MSRLRDRIKRLAPPGLDAESLSADLLQALAHLDHSIHDLAGGAGAPPGFDPSLYLAPGVPRVRPLLVLLSARTAGATDEEVTNEVAAAVELIHLAILVHDAALGRQNGLRRRAARRLLGGAVGWLGGNHLTLRALEIVQHAPAPELVGDLVNALREIAEGHALSEALRGQVPTEEQCRSYAEDHTGAVFAFACRAGARVGGGDGPTVSALGRFGRDAGVAWQMAEDLATLDIESSDAMQTLAVRAASGRPLLPIGLAAGRDHRISKAWHELAQEPSAEQAAALGHWVHECEAVADAQQHLITETWRARKVLHQLPPSPHREGLDRLMVQLVG